MRDEETTLDPDLEWGGMSGRVDGPVWMRPAGLGGRALAAECDQSSIFPFIFDRPWGGTGQVARYLDVINQQLTE